MTPGQKCSESDVPIARPLQRKNEHLGGELRGRKSPHAGESLQATIGQQDNDVPDVDADINMWKKVFKKIKTKWGDHKRLLIPLLLFCICCVPLGAWVLSEASPAHQQFIATVVQYSNLLPYQVAVLQHYLSSYFAVSEHSVSCIEVAFTGCTPSCSTLGMPPDIEQRINEDPFVPVNFRASGPATTIDRIKQAMFEKYSIPPDKEGHHELIVRKLEGSRQSSALQHRGLKLDPRCGSLEFRHDGFQEDSSNIDTNMGSSALEMFKERWSFTAHLSASVKQKCKKFYLDSNWQKYQTDTDEAGDVQKHDNDMVHLSVLDLNDVDKTSGTVLKQPYNPKFTWNDGKQNVYTRDPFVSVSARFQLSKKPVFFEICHASVEVFT